MEHIREKNGMQSRELQMKMTTNLQKGDRKLHPPAYPQAVIASPDFDAFNIKSSFEFGQFRNGLRRNVSQDVKSVKHVAQMEKSLSFYG